MTDYITIERHILAQQHKVPAATGIFSGLLNDVALAAKIIAREMSRAGLNSILGTAGQTNTHGEVQQKLDVFADSVISSTCGCTGRLCVMASEEHEDILAIPTEFASGKYVLVYDPLDGSSNIDANVSTGTIFAIYRKVTSGEHGTLEDVLQAGDNLVGAGYVIYGPSTMLVYSAGQGVFGFTLDPTLGEFLLSHDNLRIPEPPRYYSVNQGNEKFWTPGVKAYVKWLQGIYGMGQKPLAARYTGSLVMDLHRILLNGGVYMYPGDNQHSSEHPGKLRLIYEAAPLAFLVQQAGGYASNGVSSILKIKPTTLHQTVPLFIGSQVLVEQAEALLNKYDDQFPFTELQRPHAAITTS